jgi:drug/metabolite transporter (DMT)-like permease
MQMQLFYGTLGSLAALASASAWAFTSILFRRLGEDVSPLGMNLGKGIIGILFLGFALLLFGTEPLDSRTLMTLGASGLLGIALGDTLFFKGLIYLGPRLMLLLGTLGPALTIILAVIFLKERPTVLDWMGILLTFMGVTWVLWERAPRQELRANWSAGIRCALLSVLCTSIGIILAKVGVETISALTATFIRLSGGLVGLIFWGGISREMKNWLAPFRNPRLLRLLLFTVLVAIFGGFWLFLVALKYIDASIATILNSTTPLFILPMAAFMLKEKVSSRAVLGAMVAVGGIVLIFIR